MKSYFERIKETATSEEMNEAVMETVKEAKNSSKKFIEVLAKRTPDVGERYYSLNSGAVVPYFWGKDKKADQRNLENGFIYETKEAAAEDLKLVKRYTAFNTYAPDYENYGERRRGRNMYKVSDFPNFEMLRVKYVHGAISKNQMAAKLEICVPTLNRLLNVYETLPREATVGYRNPVKSAKKSAKSKVVKPSEIADSPEAREERALARIAKRNAGDVFLRSVMFQQYERYAKGEITLDIFAKNTGCPIEVVKQFIRAVSNI